MHQFILFICVIFDLLKILQIEYFPHQVMQSDLSSMGYVVEYGGVDSKNYLLPQRRNRIYATADVDNGQCMNEYQNRMRKTMEAMSSDFIIPVDAILDPNLPKEDLTTERQESKLKEAMDRASYQCQGRHVFIDGSTSKSRAAEFSVDALTCIRPSHGIYSEKFRRWVTVREMWDAQGLWHINFDNPDAVAAMLSNTKAAQDLAGNAFSSTTMQAKVLASIVHSSGWDNIGNVCAPGLDECVVVSEMDEVHSTPKSSPQSTFKRSASSLSSSEKSSGLKAPVQPELSKRRRYVGKCQPRCDSDKVAEPLVSLARLSQPDLAADACKQHVEALRTGSKKRAASKQPSDEPDKKRQYTLSGKTARDGKRGVISIHRKLQLLKATRFWLQCNTFICVLRIS